MIVVKLTQTQAEQLQGVEFIPDNFCVYRHVRLDENVPFYIGIGSQKRRAYVKVRRGKHWDAVVNKSDYRVDILFEGVTKEFALEKEKELIELYGKKSNGGTLVNITDGGDGNFGRKASPEEVEMRRKRMLENNPFKGKKHSEEAIEKMRLAKLGKKRSPEGYIKRAEKMKKYIGENHWGGKTVLDNATGIFYYTLLEAVEARGLKYIHQLRRGINAGKINYTVL